MGWQIAQKAGKFRVWSTISDAWLTDWMTREEAIKFYYDDALMMFKKQIVEKCLSFPHHWPDHSGAYRKVIVNEEGSARYLAWMHELTSKSTEEYAAFVDASFERILREMGE